MSKELKPLIDTHLQAYMSNKLQLFDVIEFVLQQVGCNAHLIVTTFSTSEEFLRKIHLFRKKKMIANATLIADIKAARKTINLWTFMKSTFDNVYLTENHSKVILITNENWNVTICTSQNQTRGNRFEAGIISTCNHIFDDFYQVTNNIIETKSIPIYDFIRRANECD